MKIVLVRPPFVDVRFGPPIGLAYLSGILKEGGHETVIYDINLELKKDITVKMDKYSRDFVLPEDHPALDYAAERTGEYCDTILSFQPDVVGIHLSYPTEEFGNRLARILSKEVRCIAGGPQATFQQAEMLRRIGYDAVVVGYGEEAVLKAVGSSGVIQSTFTPRESKYPSSIFLVTPVISPPINERRKAPSACRLKAWSLAELPL